MKIYDALIQTYATLEGYHTRLVLDRHGTYVVRCPDKGRSRDYTKILYEGTNEDEAVHMFIENEED